jgi:hypothetical protein
MDTVSITDGEFLPDSVEVPVYNQDYLFDGYWDAVDGGVQYYNPDGDLVKNILLDIDVALYAHWIERGGCAPGM